LLKLTPVFGYFEAKEGGYTQIKPHRCPGWSKSSTVSSTPTSSSSGRRRRRVGGVCAFSHDWAATHL
jgi:hypothetical protein